MTDTNTTPAEAVERVAKALQGWDDGVRFRWDDLHPDIQDRYHRQATAAIEAHTAWLWERGLSDEVVEAATTADWHDDDKAWFSTLDDEEKENYTGDAWTTVVAALTLLLGPQKEAADADR